VAVTHDLKRPFTIPSPAQAIGEICKPSRWKARVK
jgi:hypothetical protein